PRRIERLEVVAATGAGAIVTRAGEGFAAEAVAAKLAVRDRVVRGEMDAESFYSSAVAAGVTDNLIPAFAQAFTFDFDFQREIKPGDIFEAVFRERVNAEGRPVGVPELLFAGLTTEAKSAALYRFTPQGEEPGWFDGNGRSIVRAFMRTPVDGARVSSNFGYRTHPILGYQKLHRGVDFAAPTGTPIFAAGDGLVEFAAMKGANGNFVALRHDNGWRTLYLHMNAFGPGVVAGARLRQGQQVGEVGTTGRSTGPHLHYEVHIDGQPVDPMTVQVGEGRTLTGPKLEAFRKVRDQIDQVRQAAR
ncbi:MAG TPA: peptidoglycan DD-metalloendopeptidase family protein, partial [Phenylobacterium sp.]|nr:peptidoglycan DD-metalloendopeptidase family protein [Phenylobacterium sp.]